MIRHIVMFKLVEFPTPEEKRNAAETLKNELLNMKSRIPVIVDFEVGINIHQDPSAWDLVINATFHSKEDLEIYSNHPDHRSFISVNKNFSEKKAVVDFELTESF